MSFNFMERLEKWNINDKMILNALSNVDESTPIYAYTSHIEGLGTESSDIDIYVLCDQRLDTKDIPVKDNVDFSTVSLDVEYWSIDDVHKFIDEINTTDKKISNITLLKFIYRLKIGKLLNGHDIGNSIKEKIQLSSLSRHLYRIYRNNSLSQLDDGIYLYNNKDSLGALNCVRAAVQDAIGALNTSNGRLNMKPKWITRLFLENKGYDEKLLERYLTTQIYSQISESSINSHVEGLIELTQDILSKACL